MLTLNFRKSKMLYFSIFLVIADESESTLKFESFEPSKIKKRYVTYLFSAIYARNTPSR